MYTNSKFVYTTVLLLALVAIATPAELRADEGELLERRRAGAQQMLMACDEASCNGNKHCKGGKCVCKDGFTGANCERAACKCNPLGGSCNPSGKCECEVGFKGELCYEYACGNNCSSTTTVNRATGCEVAKTGNTCVCKDGFTGTTCQTAACGADSGAACSGRGTCDEAKNKCSCNKGWGGEFCNEIFGCGACVNGQCSNGTCACSKGYRGAKCNKRLCAGTDGITCSGHGRCNKDTAGNDVSCTCGKGFDGAQCELTTCPIDKNGVTCGGDYRGSCNQETKQCECNCDMDSKDPKKCFGGAACQVLACAASISNAEVCNNHGQCTIEGKGTDRAFMCKCAAGYTGKTCEFNECPVSSDTNEECGGKNRGACANGVCECKYGWGGDACDQSSCEKAHNGNVCGEPVQGFCDAKKGQCVCSSGFRGINCDSKMCEKNPDNGLACGGKSRGKCMNDGTCMCTGKFTGSTCELFKCMKGNPGTGARCAPGGQCHNGTCVCRKSYYGNRCQFKKCPTSVNGTECSNHGLCYKEGPSMGTCTCKTGWTGPGCGELACPLGCSGNGKCIKGKCLCSAKWMGPGCEEYRCPITNGHMCSNHGTCNNGTCDCDTIKEGDKILGGYYGDQTCHLPYCGIHSNETKGCSGNGNCVDKVCQCKKGFYGEYCSKKRCPKDCSGRGKCGDNGVCKCNIGFSGNACNEQYCAPLNCSGHGVCDAQKMKCVCDKTEAFGYTGKGCSKLTGPATDEDAEKKALEFAKKLNMTLNKEKEAAEARRIADKLHEEAEKKALKNGDVLNATKQQMNNLKKQQSGALDAIKELEGDLSKLNKTAVAMAEKAKDAKAEANAKNAKTAEEAKKLKNKKLIEEKAKKSLKMQCRAENDKFCAGRGECGKDGKCVCDDGFDSSNNCMYKLCPGNGCSGNGECLQGRCLCGAGFTGTDCSMKVCLQDCGANGWCNNGTCACELGWEPSAVGANDCAKKTKTSEAKALGMACPLKCSGRGVCDEGTCKCDAGFGGVGCENKICPENCNGHGTCAKGSCLCDAGFMGPACAAKDCSNLNHCGGEKQGKCVNGTCACIAPFAGKDCGVKENKCLNDCSGHGKCFDSVCYCGVGWVGKDCHKQVCVMDDPTCSGHGNCTGATCTCKKGWKGELCELQVKKCPKGCSGNGVCDDVKGVCTCSKGFSGKACDILPCKHKCLNNGQCKNGTCLCAPGWAGAKCNVPSCKNDCSGNGKCVLNDDDAGKHCVCNKGYQGDDCSENVKGCIAKNGKECGGNGVCILGKCDCAEGYSGALCTISLCEPMDCSGNGRCVQGKCVCKGSWGGDACDEKECPADATGNKCYGHGVCTQQGCKCAKGWCGEGCSDVEKVKKPCPGTPMCSGHGVCRDEGTEAHCVCDSGFTDKDCSVTDCPKGCSGNGVCDKNTLTCTCNPKFMGEACDKKSCIGCTNGRCLDGQCMCNVGWGGDNCTTELCPGNCGAHGVCENDARCVCKDGFSGKGCEVAPGCPDACSDNGVCIPIPGANKGSKCKCKAGFAGLACEMEICPGAKSGKMCSGHGKCNNKQLLAGVESPCKCKTGWNGLKCETPVCPNDCSGNGVCNLKTKKCTCAVGFKGEDCNVEGCDKGYMTKDPSKRCAFQYCNPIDCNGHGECSPKAQKCVCQSGWIGAGCGQALCPKNCNNNGRCRSVDGAKNLGMCDCNQGFSGKHCEIQYCGLGNDCSKHGSCNHETQMCECSVGFNGPHCNNTYCGPNADCNNHGFCNQKNARCDCHPGYAGELCFDTYCPPSCSVHGRCDHDAKKCVCNKNWAGLGCDQWTGAGTPPKQNEEHQGTIPLIETVDKNLTETPNQDALLRAVDETTVQLFEKYPSVASQIAEVATRAADGNYAVAKKFGDTLMAVAADLVLQSCDYKCQLNEVDGTGIDKILKDIIAAEPLLSADMDRKRVKISLLDLLLQRALFGGAKVAKRSKTRHIAATAYKEYELSFKSAKELIKKAVVLMKEVAQYKNAAPVDEGMLATMAMSQADLQMGKGRTIVEEVLIKKIAQKEFPLLGDEVAKEVAGRVLPLAQVDSNAPITSALMKKAEQSMTTLITTAKAHSFYRGIDDGTPEVEDAETAFHELVKNGGDQKKALNDMKIEEAIEQGRSKGKNVTQEEVKTALKAANGNYKSGLRGLGIQGSSVACPNKCNGHGKCVNGVCHCEVGFTGSKDCKKPVSGTGCIKCCVYEALDECRHLSAGKSTAKEQECYENSYNKCFNACQYKDQAQQLSCSSTLERLNEKKDLPSAVRKLVAQEEKKRKA